jgi:hypothetical protein
MLVYTISVSFSRQKVIYVLARQPEKSLAPSHRQIRHRPTGVLTLITWPAGVVPAGNGLPVLPPILNPPRHLLRGRRVSGLVQQPLVHSRQLLHHCDLNRR